MRLLIDFLCRFGWGLAIGLVATSPRMVTPGFFRVNSLVVLGLATAAALLAGGASRGPGLPAAIAAVLAWLASGGWLAGHPAIGLILGAGAAAGLGLATVRGADPAQETGLLGAGGPLLSGLVVGLTVHAMLLGHWYLNAPGMQIRPLVRAIDAALVAWAATLASVLLAPAGLTPPSDPTAMALLALRWLAGLVALPVLLVMSRRTLAIPNTQSATGILYVACLAAIAGELTSQLLAAGSPGPG